jgi:hypothetical protein
MGALGYAGHCKGFSRSDYPRRSGTPYCATHIPATSPGTNTRRTSDAFRKMRMHSVPSVGRVRLAKVPRCCKV